MGIRLLKLIAVFFLVLHMVACMVWWLAYSQATAGDTETPFMAYLWKDFSVNQTLTNSLDDRGHPDMLWGAFVYSPLFEQYMHAFYWAQLCILGADMYPETYSETVFTNIVTVLGIAVFAIIIGSASSLVANLDQTAIERKREMDKMRYYLRFHGVPRPLQVRITRFFEFSYSAGYDSETSTKLFSGLPGPLRTELDLNLKQELINTVHIFKMVTIKSVLAVVGKLQSRIAVPDQVVIRQLEPAKSVYFITKGSCRVDFSHLIVSDKGSSEKSVHLGNMLAGATFGEIALLNHGPRTCNVQAEGFVEMEELLAPDFYPLLERHDDMRDEFISLGALRYDQTRKITDMLETADISTHRTVGTMSRMHAREKDKGHAKRRKQSHLPGLGIDTMEEEANDDRFEHLLDIATNRSQFVKKQLSKIAAEGLKGTSSFRSRLASSSSAPATGLVTKARKTSSWLIANLSPLAAKAKKDAQK